MEFLVSVCEFLVDQKRFWYTKKKFGRPKIPWDWTIFFWSTKINDKKTEQLVDQETDQNHMDGTVVSRNSSELVYP